MSFCRESTQNLTSIELNLRDGRKKNIIIQPGEAYGRGKYGSTNLCVSAIEKIFASRKVENVLDVGSGTGILSICAAMLGANVVALDVDHVAVQETKINLIKNRVDDKVQVVFDSLGGVDGKFDLVVANLGNTQILNLAEGLNSKLNEDGLLLVSGIWMNAQKQNVCCAFRGLNLKLIEELTIGGWFALIFDKNP